MGGCEESIMRQKYRYERDGIKFPSVTSLLPKRYVGFSKYNRHNSINRDVLGNKAEYGTDKHQLLKDAIDGDENEFTKYIPEIEEKFGKILFREKSLFSTKYHFAGTPDIITERAIIDFKTSMTNKKYYSLQLAGYNILTTENGILNTKKHILFTINDKGKAVFKNVYSDESSMIFKLCLQEHQNKKKFKQYLRGM